MSDLKFHNDSSEERCTLTEYIRQHRSQDELRELFLNVDIALKYIHDHNYCIELFHPSKIFVLGDLPDHIQFDSLMELPHDSAERKDMIKEDIFRSSLIQIGIYSNIGDYLKPQFLKENFDEISMLLPEGDVPYYRGVVLRGASVYLSEYALEKRNRDLQQLDKEIGDDGESPVLKEKLNGSFSNNKINDKIYRQINGLKDRAFVSIMMIPTILLMGLIIMSLLSWIRSLM